MYTLYNEMRKRAFLSAKAREAGSNNVLLSLFERIAEHECRYERDFAEMDESQRSKTVSEVAGLSRKTIYAAESTLREYVRWCSERGYAISGEPETIRADITERIRRSMVYSPADLLTTLQSVFPEPDIHGIHAVYRSYLWLAFAGLEEQEAIRLTPEHLHFNKMEIRLPGANFSSYPIYAEAAEDFKKACAMEQICENKGKKNISLIWKDRAPGNLILRGKMTDKPLEEVLKTSIRPLVSRAFARAAQTAPANVRTELSYRRAYMSGVFYREWLAEKEGFEANFIKYARVDFDNRNRISGYKLNDRYNENHVISVLRKSYEDDYRRWKEAFRLI